MLKCLDNHYIFSKFPDLILDPNFEFLDKNLAA